MAGGRLGERQGTARATSLGRVLSTMAPRATVLVRLLVGGVFLSEGIQKFLYPEALGAGRFEGIGIPFPGFSAPFVGVLEIVCGALIVVGLLTRWRRYP